MVHLCGAASAKAFARRGFCLIAGKRCGDYDVATPRLLIAVAGWPIAAAVGRGSWLGWWSGGGAVSAGMTATPMWFGRSLSGRRGSD